MKERESESSEKSIAGTGAPTGTGQATKGWQDLGRFENKYTFLPTENSHIIRHPAPDYGRLAPRAGV